MNKVEVVKDRTGEFLRNMQALIAKEVLIGIPAEKTARKDGVMNNATIGYIHENGSSAANIPPRPFLVPGVGDASEKCAEYLKLPVQEIFNKSAADKAFNRAGLHAVSVVRGRIVSQTGIKPLSAATLAMRKNRKKGNKKGTKALIDTGSLLNSITYAIRDKK